MADAFGPGGVYANIPRLDSHGRPQLPMFMRWNPDPVGNDAKNLAALSPDMQKVIAQARADNPNLHFVIGNGKRSAADQDQAKAWGWSQVGSKDGGDANVHMAGNAVDLWGLDSTGRVQFDPGQQKQISQAIQDAAKKAGVGVNWGGNWKSFKDAPHFELAGSGSAASSGSPEGPPAQNTAPAPAPAPAPVGTTINSTPSGSLSPTDRDWIIRTVAGEADPNAAGQTAVANVIKNRLQTGRWGNTGQGVVLAPGQFSMWNDKTGYAGGAGANKGGDLSPNSSTYQSIGGIVDNVFSGQTPDPTKGALNYYAPGGMKGGKAPAWAAEMTNPITIGAQVYGTAPSTGPARPVTATPSSAYAAAPGPIDPSIIAHGGTSPPIPGTTLNAPAVASTQGVLPGFPDKATSDNFTQGAKAFDNALHGGQDPGQEDNKAAAFNFLPARNVSPLIPPAGSGQVSPQTYGTTLAGMMAPLQWNAQAPGHMYGAAAGGAPIGQQFGTQLGSMQQLQQMMAMMGNPYGDSYG